MIWHLLKFRIKWIREHYFRWTVIPTWKYWYVINRTFEEGCQTRLDYIHQISSILTLVERLEKNEAALNTIAYRQGEVIRKYVKFFRDTGITEEILDKDFSGTGFSGSLYQVRIDSLENKEDGERTGNQKEHREDSGETPGD